MHNVGAPKFCCMESYDELNWYCEMEKMPNCETLEAVAKSVVNL